LNTPLAKGIPLVIMSHFDMEDFCKFVEKYKVTMSMIVPPICLALLHHPAVNKYNIKSLKYLLSAAAPLGKQLVLAVREKLRSVGADNVHIFQGPRISIFVIIYLWLTMLQATV
jgi:acyl-CoA synthetase (AMP-forming)/AMP-acid ligase II